MTASISLTSPAGVSAAEVAAPQAAHGPRIAGVGTAVSGKPYSQQDLLEIFHIEAPKVRSIFLNSVIQRRYLSLPPRGIDGVPVLESQGDLLDKHKALAVDMGARAVQSCLADAGAELRDIRYLCCVTSTGFLTPGISALLIREMGIDPH